jgi:hypothetical protein
VLDVKRVVARLAFEDEADVQQVIGSALKHLPGLRGVAIMSGEGSTILTAADSVDEGTAIAEFLVGDDQRVEEEE